MRRGKGNFFPLSETVLRSEEELDQLIFTYNDKHFQHLIRHVLVYILFPSSSFHPHLRHSIPDTRRKESSVRRKSSSVRRETGGREERQETRDSRCFRLTLFLSTPLPSRERESGREIKIEREERKISINHSTFIPIKHSMVLSLFYCTQMIR